MLVTTFVGDGFNWAGVRALMAPQDLAILPHYQPLVPPSTYSADGLASWAAWPEDATALPVDAVISEVFDFAYDVALAPTGGPYMAPVSPWFWRHAAGASTAHHR